MSQVGELQLDLGFLVSGLLLLPRHLHLRWSYSLGSLTLLLKYLP
jgi:hypothetical protein